jgi:hypothetical protein
MLLIGGCAASTDVLDAMMWSVDSRHWSLQNQCAQWQLELGTVEHRHSTTSTQMTRNTVRDHN